VLFLCTGNSAQSRWPIGAHLAQPATQADHAVEALVDEHVQVFGHVSGDVEAVLVSHHPHRVGVRPDRIILDECRAGRPPTLR
jgi:hypothetical protein